MTKADRPVALVTGGSRGIGLGIAEALARSGFDIVINGRREVDDVVDAVTRIERVSEGRVRCAYIRGDVSDLAQHGELLDAVRDRFGRLDSLVNNAGVAPASRADLLDASPESFDRVLRINLRGPYFLTQRVARWMVEQKGDDPSRVCSIVNVSSVSATVASVNRGEYCISKAGVAMATRLWAARLGEFGIGVYEVRPGVIRTDMTAEVAERYDRLFEEGIAVEKRWGTPEDVGSAVATLVRGELTYASGQVLMIDGGLTLQRL